MKKALTKKDASEVKDVTEPTFSDDELAYLSQLLKQRPTADAIRTLAAKFGPVDGIGEALSLMTAAVAMTGSDCARRASACSYLNERELELTLLTALAGATTKLTRAWDEHLNRNKPEVNLRDVNVAPGAQAVVGVVGLPDGSAAKAAETQKGKVARKRLKPEDDASQA
jgi:hypothetical protein